MENEEEKTTTTTEGQTTPSTSSYTDPSFDKTKQKTGGLDYINKAAQTGQEGAEALEKNVKVQKYTPITYKMLKGDPEVRRGIPSLIRNAVFKGLEGALSTKASGRNFDPTTRMGQYDDAEMQRYTENATDLENSIYQAQKQPIENAISAKAQAGIQTEDAALNSYIQDYTAEKDQNRKFALLQQVMGQAGLTKGVDENGNPILKDWTELKTADLLKLNQLMQYLSGDTSVMNLLVGQYGPGIMNKVDELVNWITGKSDKNPFGLLDEEDILYAPQYTEEDLKAALANNDPQAILYKNSNIVELPDGTYYDVYDNSNEGLTKLAKSIAEMAKQGKSYKGVLDEVEKKTKAATGGGWFNKNGKNARTDVETLAKYYIDLNNQQAQEDFVENSDTSGLNISDVGEIQNDMKKLESAKNGTVLPVDTDDLLARIDASTLDEETKKEYKDTVNENKRSIELNAAIDEENKRREIIKKDAENRAKDLKKGALKSVQGLTKTDYATAKLKKGKKESDLYSEALNEAKALYDALQGTGEPIQVLKKTDIWERLRNICLTSQGDGRFAELDKSYAEINPDKNSLGSYLADMGDFSKWGK